MPDSVRKVSYFSIDVRDEPGEAFKVLTTLVSAGINLLACSGHTGGGRARIEVVPDDTEKFVAAMAHAGLAFSSPESGLYIRGDARPGALAQHLEKLAVAGVNVAHINALSAGEGRWGAIIWIAAADIERAAHLLGAAA